MRTIDEVRQLVLSAFADVKRPRSSSNWKELDKDYLRKHWSGICRSPAASFNYYLPALLIGALDDLPVMDDIVHSTIFGICPSFHDMYYFGTDRAFERRVKNFTNEQFEAVAAFFGLMLTAHELDYFTVMAARAFKFGWDRVETPERQQFENFYKTMHTWRYEGDTPEETASLAKMVTSAFANTPYPGDQNICGSHQGDEPTESALDFRGVAWQNLHPRLLLYNYTALSFLSADGFRYYLPAFLMAELYGEDHASNVDCVFHLTHGFYKKKPVSEIIDEAYRKIFLRLKEFRWTNGPRC